MMAGRHYCVPCRSKEAENIKLKASRVGGLSLFVECRCIYYLNIVYTTYILYILPI